MKNLLIGKEWFDNRFNIVACWSRDPTITVEQYADLICEIQEETFKLIDAKIGNRMTDELIFDLVWEYCSDKSGIIDTGCLSVYENACMYLEHKGYLKSRDRRIYHLTEKGKKEFGFEEEKWKKTKK